MKTGRVRSAQARVPDATVAAARSSPCGSPSPASARPAARGPGSDSPAASSFQAAPPPRAPEPAGRWRGCPPRSRGRGGDRAVWAGGGTAWRWPPAKGQELGALQAQRTPGSRWARRGAARPAPLRQGRPRPEPRPVPAPLLAATPRAGHLVAGPAEVETRTSPPADWVAGAAFFQSFNKRCGGSAGQSPSLCPWLWGEVTRWCSKRPQPTASTPCLSFPVHPPWAWCHRGSAWPVRGTGPHGEAR